MPQAGQGAWGPWTRHDGSCMPVPTGTIVHAFSLADPKSAKDGIIERIGVAGVDLVNSWFWTDENRDQVIWLPIDWYRSKRPRGLMLLEEVLLASRELKEEHA